MKDVIISEEVRKKNAVREYYGYYCASKSGLSIKFY